MHIDRELDMDKVSFKSASENLDKSCIIWIRINDEQLFISYEWLFIVFFLNKNLFHDFRVIGRIKTYTYVLRLFRSLHGYMIAPPTHNEVIPLSLHETQIRRG